MPLRYVSRIDPIVLPLQGFLFMWYDFTDITQLYQDDTWMTPVTTHGQAVEGVTDKGPASNDLNADSAAGSFLYNTGPGWGTIDSTSAAVALWKLSTAALVPSGAGYTVFSVFRADAANRGLGIHWKWKGADIYELRTFENFADDMHLNNIIYSPDNISADGVWQACILQNRTNSTQLLHHNGYTSSAGESASVLYKQPPITQEIIVGAFNETGASPHRGLIAECGMYDFVDSDSGFETIVAEFKTYTTLKYGIVWPS